MINEPGSQQHLDETEFIKSIRELLKSTIVDHFSFLKKKKHPLFLFLNIYYLVISYLVACIFLVSLMASFIIRKTYTILV